MDVDFGPDYSHGMTDDLIRDNWPNLEHGINFHWTSKKKRQYNCISWAFNITDYDIDMLWYKDKYKLDEAKLDHSASGYANAFMKFHSELGFEICDDFSLEEGFEKIALYELDNDFRHISRQLANGNWTSKMGKLEDIEHYDLSAVAGDCGESSYGFPAIFMKRKL